MKRIAFVRRFLQSSAPAVALIVAAGCLLFFLSNAALSTLSAASVAPKTVTTVYLVRHAEKETQPPADPPLTEAGKARAQELARVLGQAKIKTIISSQFARTQQTAEPIARKLGLSVTTLPIQMDTMNPRELSQASIKAIVDKIRAQSGQEVLVVGHSNTVPEVIKMLGGDSVPTIDDKEFDDLFVVTLYDKNKAKVVRLKYGASH